MSLGTPFSVSFGTNCCCTGTGTPDCGCSYCVGTGTGTDEARYLTITGTTDCDSTIILRCNDSFTAPPDLADVGWLNDDPFGDSNSFPPGPCLPNGAAPDASPYIWAFFCDQVNAYLYFEPAVGLGTPMVFTARVYTCDPFYAEFDLAEGLINVNLCCDGAAAAVGVVTK